MTPRKLTERKARVEKMIPILKGLFPDARIVLNYSNNWELLVAVELSAQCTDKKVNEVTKDLFKKYRNLSDYLSVDQKTCERDIKPIGFYHSKAKNILVAAKMVRGEFGGEDTSDVSPGSFIPGLPGSGRKSKEMIESV